MVELVAVEVEAADQRAHGAAVRIDRDQRRLHFGQLGDLPRVLAGAAQADDRAAPHTAALWRFLCQHRGDEAEALAGDADFLPAAIDDDLLGAGLEHDRGEQVAVVADLAERFVELLLGDRAAGQVGERFRPAVTVAAVVIDHAAPQCRVGGLLVGARHRGDDADAQLVGLFAELFDGDLAGHLGHIVAGYRDVLDLARGGGVALALARGGEGERLFKLRVVDEAGLEHAPQYILLAHGGARRIDDRVEGGGRLRQPGEHGRFGQAELLERLAVVGARGGGKAVGALAEEDLVDVELEDLVLAEVLLDLQRQQDLVQLAVVGLLARQEEVARHLHGDGRCALAAAAGRQVGERGAGEADRVDTLVFVEAFVLRGEDGVLERGRNFGDAHYVTALLSELANEVSIGRIYSQRHPGTVVGERVERRQVGPREQGHCRERGKAEDDQRDQRCDRIQDPAHGQSRRVLSGRALYGMRSRPSQVFLSAVVNREAVRFTPPGLVASMRQNGLDKTRNIKKFKDFLCD